jgi:hypothetical protein
MIDFRRQGRMLDASKTWYRTKFPTHEVVFNANIATKKQGKIWQGDLDLTTDIDALKRFSVECNEEIYILREMDGRFKNEKTPRFERFVMRITPRGDVIRPEPGMNF